MGPNLVHFGADMEFVWEHQQYRCIFTFLKITWLLVKKKTIFYRSKTISYD
jgi:hypothetical protein